MARKKQPQPNDIVIGKGAWISYGKELSAEQLAQATQIDPLLAPIVPFLEKLETECVVACCGIDAFGFLPEQIQAAVVGYAKEDLRAKLALVHAIVDELPGDTVSSSLLNQYFPKRVFLELLGHIRNVVEDSPEITA